MDVQEQVAAWRAAVAKDLIECPQGCQVTKQWCERFQDFLRRNRKGEEVYDDDKEDFDDSTHSQTGWVHHRQRLAMQTCRRCNRWKTKPTK
jgi:hypothetical protein